MAAGKRLLSLDVLRGITVAAMILVNNPAVWGEAYAPLQHAFWHGLTPTDLIYPFFVFIMGVSAYFSLCRRGKENQRATIFHVLRRSALIFVVGVLLNLISALAYGRFALETFRIMGVLQGLALAYLFGSFLIMALKFRKLIICSLGLLAVYWLILLLGNGFELSPDNVIAVVDRALLGEGHLYMERLADGSRMAFEPESVLSIMPRTAQFMLGAAVGRVFYENDDVESRLNKIFILGSVLLICGFLIQYGCPVNKKIWSPSFAMVTSGFGSLSVALLYKLIDVDAYKSWTGFFHVFGVNPLFLYVAAWLFSVLVNMKIKLGEFWSIKNWFYGNCIEPFTGTAFGSLVYSLIFVCVIWSVGYLLYRKKIYVKL